MKYKFILIFAVSVAVILSASAMSKKNESNKLVKEMEDYVVDNDTAKLTMLGNMYYSGDGISSGKDYNRALELYRKAAEQGDRDAQYNIGVMYYNGQGVNQSYQESREWFIKSAKKGNSDAQFSLGVIYYEGNGFNVDIDYANTWFKKSCENGDERGCEYYEITKN